MHPLTPAQLLAEIEDALRAAPTGDFRVGQPDAISWLGRTAALVRRWSSMKAIDFDSNASLIFMPGTTFPAGAMSRLLLILNEARHDLRLNEVGPLSVAIPQGAVLDYFEEVRRVLTSARVELFFVDPYIDAEFVSRYLPQAPKGVRVRLMTKKGAIALAPAVQLARQQYGLAIELRSSAALHDRFVFVDGTQGYQSGPSFKDGARLSPAIFTEVTDALQAVLVTYENMWAAAVQHP